MRLHLLRHAIAVPRAGTHYPNDDRPLTEDGRKKMRKAAGGIAAAIGTVDIIFSSPLKRALDTARIAAKELGLAGKITILEELLPGREPGMLVNALLLGRQKESLLIVGHEPDLGVFASTLLGSPALSIVFKKGGLCRIDVDELRTGSTGRLIYHLTPKQLRLLSPAKQHDRTKPLQKPPLSGPSHRRRRNRRVG
ncbi:MAG TPA: phosphohistidine phosphatase SixA [Bacteroidota bacterium]|jgi:phosphohistidine phosphatase